MASKKVKKFKFPKNHLAQACTLERNPNRRDRIMNFEHIIKFHDALHFGASERDVSLPSNCIREIKKNPR